LKKSVAEITPINIIERFVEAQRDKGKAELTAKTYRQVIEAFSRYLNDKGGSLNALTRFDIQSYITYLEAEGRTATTLNKTFSTIRVFAKFIKRLEITDNIRLPEVRKVQHIAPKCLECNELNNLLRKVERKNNPRDTAIVYTLLYTGVRVSELVALNREDITISTRSGSLKVRNGKGNVARTVPLPGEARLYLTEYLEEREDNNPALFLSNYRKRISVRSVQHLLKKLGTYPHQLRHSYCSVLVRKGIDIATVAELAGHSDINTTRRYSKPTAKELTEAIDKAFFS